jgi:hypothetical protein
VEPRRRSPPRECRRPARLVGAIDPQDLARVVDLVALTYHEARNVRHLIAKGMVEAEPYTAVTSLPKDKFGAWEQLARFRRDSLIGGDLDAVLKLFRNHFQLSLEDLESLYEHPGWRHAAYGGNAWAGITRAVIEATNKLQSREGAAASRFLEEIMEMRHNTGVVEEKLRLLGERSWRCRAPG